VIGKNGIDLAPGDIWADKLGRVRVRFPWDRTPAGAEAAKNDPLNASAEWTDGMAKPQYLVGTDTAWLRVSDAWAGLRQFGTQFLPRVGDEVVVSFIDSDPDRPIVTGRVYNSYNRDANHPFPPQGDTTSIDDMQSLRKLQGTKDWNYSGVKTRSMPLKVTDKDRFHLLRFDDTKDKEQYLIRSQRRLDITALEKRYESISSDRHLTVGGVDQKTHTIGGNYITKIFKDYNLHVGDPAFPFQSGDRKTKLEGAESLSVGQNSDESIGGNWSISVGGGPTVGGQVSISALLGAGIISQSALLNITLMCGPSSIVITPAAISINSPSINLVGAVFGAPVIGPPAPLPPAPAIPAVPQSPQEPTPADPGDKPVPPKE
jgi:type VI secretion system secreted protein VgrG